MGGGDNVAVGNFVGVGGIGVFVMGIGVSVAVGSGGNGVSVAVGGDGIRVFVAVGGGGVDVLIAVGGCVVGKLGVGTFFVECNVGVDNGGSFVSGGGVVTVDVLVNVTVVDGINVPFFTRVSDGS